MLAGQRLLLLLQKNETAQSIAIAISVAGLIFGLVVIFLEWPVDEFRALASLNYSEIDYHKVTCLSIDSRKVTIEGQRYSDPELAKSIADILSIKPVLVDATRSECPWYVFFNAAAGPIYAVHEGLLPTQYLVSIGICERTDDRHVNSNKCLNKNIYIFNWRVKPHDLFRIGLIGLRPETKDEEEFKVKAEHD